MSRLCPRCNEAYEDRWYCPTCGVRLVAEGGGTGKGKGRVHKETEPMQRPAPSKVMETLSRLFALKGKGAKWQQTTWGRCLIGLLLAQGLYYALLALMLTFGLRASGDDIGSLLLRQLLQGVAVVGGGIVAGAGQRRAVRNGVIVGLYNAVIFLIVDGFLHDLSLWTVFGQSLLQIAFGTLGGYLGRLIWPPIISIVSVRAGRPALLGEGEREVGTAQLNTAGLAPIPLPEPFRKPNPFSGQINWVQVIIGVVIVVAGSVSAETVLNRYILNPDRLPAGLDKMDLGVESKQQAQFITWEISVLAMIFGGAFAGANTFNGPLQGIIVGILSTTALIGNILQSGMEAIDAAHTIGLSFLGVNLNSTVMQIVGTIFSVMPLTIVGGWFGGQLLPPVLPERKVSKIYTSHV